MNLEPVYLWKNAVFFHKKRRKIKYLKSVVDGRRRISYTNRAVVWDEIDTEIAAKGVIE
jgi:hypothetical protein